MNYIKKNLDQIIFYFLSSIYYLIRIVETFKGKEVTTFQCILDLFMFIALMFIISIDIKEYKKIKDNKEKETK